MTQENILDLVSKWELSSSIPTISFLVPNRYKDIIDVCKLFAGFYDLYIHSCGQETEITLTRKQINIK